MLTESEKRWITCTSKCLIIVLHCPTLHMCPRSTFKTFRQPNLCQTFDAEPSINASHFLSYLHCLDHLPKTNYQIVILHSLPCRLLPTENRHGTPSRLLLIKNSFSISSLVSLPATCPNIAFACTAASQTQVNDEAKDTKRSTDPHEGKHLSANRGTNA